MKRITFLLVAVVAVFGVVSFTSRTSRRAAAQEAAPVFGIKLPPGYRDWNMISVAHVGGPVNDLRVKLGNDVAMKSFRDGTRPFPDGTIIARLAYHQVTSEENNVAIRPFAERSLSPEETTKLLNESFVAGSPTNVQFMVKDLKKIRLDRRLGLRSIYQRQT